MFFCLYLLIVLITMLTNEGKMIRSGFCEIIVHFIEESDRKTKRKCFFLFIFFLSIYKVVNLCSNTISSCPIKQILNFEKQQ